ncbi:hypothetical protein FCM35_KLT05565 [Carex littledalei]|uniref:Cysteine-rich transmembrane CYSTM domain-containing protein n=1 Tax=Carex littledalei TaxID=544730 RepID=A0A833QUQ3_9POAL|nr:hypothetical protein FCM35_KLT05565 [Carex littledalei]
MNDPKYAHPYPPQGYYQGPPVSAPPQYPQYTAPPPPRRNRVLQLCAVAAWSTSVAAIRLSYL